jgi:ATP-dependent helicase HrpB
MVQDAPDLPGIGTVIFDEFHERSLNADLGLALTWEARGALRPDLRILVMSATLDAGPVAAMLDDAPMISSQGRAYPVETRWLDRAPGPDTRWDRAMADLILRAMAETEGSCLAFLPGEGEIRRVAACWMGVCRGTCTSVHSTARCPSATSAPRSDPRPRGANWCWPRPSPRPR